MIEDHFGMYIVLIPHCTTEILAKECKSGKSTVLALGTVAFPSFVHSSFTKPCLRSVDNPRELLCTPAFLAVKCVQKPTSE